MNTLIKMIVTAAFALSASGATAGSFNVGDTLNAHDLILCPTPGTALEVAQAFEAGTDVTELLESCYRTEENEQDGVILLDMPIWESQEQQGEERYLVVLKFFDKNRSKNAWGVVVSDENHEFSE